MQVLDYVCENGRGALCVVHGDMHDGNVIKASSDGSYVVYEWGSA